MVVCKDRLDRIKADERLGVEAAAAVEGDITALLAGKTFDELVSLQRQVQGKLNSGEPIDTDYWEGLLRKLIVWKAKVCSWCEFILVVSDTYVGQTAIPSRSCCPQQVGAA